jgi:hypothetical protein
MLLFLGFLIFRRNIAFPLNLVNSSALHICLYNVFSIFSWLERRVFILFCFVFFKNFLLEVVVGRR